MVDMQYVESSNVEQIGYDADAMELHVTFKKGSITYVYEAVPKELYEALLAAASIGSFLNREIKPVFSFHKI